MQSDWLTRKRTHFLLWRPANAAPPPALLIGRAGDPPASYREFPLTPDPSFPELWQVAAADCGLADGTVYYYWFRVGDSAPWEPATRPLYCTDPAATGVDRSVPPPTPPGGTPSGDPASVVGYVGGALVPCDNGGPAGPLQPDWEGDPGPETLPVNDSLVIYELPTRWAHTDAAGQTLYGNGTFQDVLALVVVNRRSPSFPAVPAFANRAHLQELGVTALELLPCADQDQPLTWGYGTSNFFAADYDLGKPPGQALSTATTDLVALVKACHQNGLRFFVDVVISWCRSNPYVNANFLDFFLKDTGDPEWDGRNGWGGQLPKYNYAVAGYDPLGGGAARIVPARRLMLTYIQHWLNFYRVDGLRLDDVPNIPPAAPSLPDFLQEFTALARATWNDRGGSDDRFLTLGEDLAVPANTGRVLSGQLDGLWNDTFRDIARPVLLGRNWDHEPSFESSIHKLLDPRWQGFTDTSQIVNYLGSHDVEGFGRQRLYNWFVDNNVAEAAPRIELGFACLLTAIGIPLILAGDEFADQMDPPPPGMSFDQFKQMDPVNWSLLFDDWRLRLFNVVCRLVRLRATSPALASGDIAFLHADFDGGKRVMAWSRSAGTDMVVAVANFSDWGTPDPTNPASEYQVSNWPPTPPGRSWQEITQDRPVPAAWAGREPLYPWQANVYHLI